MYISRSKQVYILYVLTHKHPHLPEYIRTYVRATAAIGELGTMRDESVGKTQQ